MQTRQTTDKETKENLIWLTLYVLPSKMKDGKLWFPKKAESTITVCVNEKKAPQDYSDLQHVLPGSLFDITYGFNEYSGKAFISKCELVEFSSHTEDKLYI